MTVFVIFVFDKNNYPSTTEYVAIFSTREKAEKYIKNHKKDYDSLQELYFEEKYVL